MGPTAPQLHHLGGKLGQLVADVIVNLHPHVSRLAEIEKAEFRAKFLDGLEDHTAQLVRPLLESVLDSTKTPDELRGLMAELGAPTEQFTGIISQFFIFGVMFTLAQAMLAPFVTQVENDVWAAHPVRPISPPDIATAVVRGIGFGDSSSVVVPEWATTEAGLSGLDADRFSTMVGVTGMAPALQLLFEMIRRGIIEEGALDAGGTTLVSGIQQSDVKDEWIDPVAKLRYVQPSPIDMVRAAVQSQWDDTPIGTGIDLPKQWATALGLEPPDWVAGNPDWFNILYNSAGRPPGPVEMGHAANRGLTPWQGTGSASVAFDQAIRESDIKDKYIPLLELLAVYWPPSGEVMTLLKHGGLDVDQAKAYWKANGVPDELATAYLYVSQIEQVTQDKALAKGDIESLLQENLIDDDQALTLLGEVGYSGENATLIVEMAHFRYELQALRAGIRTISTLYTSKKITATEAQTGFQGLGLAANQIEDLLATLDFQRRAEVVIPTAAQVAAGLYYQVIDQPTAMTMLEDLGYSAFDAWFVLSVRLHGPLPGAPGGYVPPASGAATGAASTTTTTTTTTAAAP